MAASPGLWGPPSTPAPVSTRSTNLSACRMSLAPLTASGSLPSASSSLAGQSARQLARGVPLRPMRHDRGTARLRVTSMAADYYSTLGVPKSATKADIKGAYRKLARQFHPDVNKEPGAEDKFKAISEAYEILSDDEKRPLYDRFGEAGVKSGAGMGGPAGGAYAGTNPFDLFESFFGQSMGGMGGATTRRRGPVQGSDIKMEITLDFKESIFGAEKRLEMSHLETCGSCSGSGARPGTAPSTCPACRGMGQVMQTRQTPFGMFSQVSTCATCSGSGEVITDFCKRCSGEGRLRIRKQVPLTIPEGVASGSALRVRGDGDAGLRGGPPGDLYVFVNVKEHPSIRREGLDLYSTITLDYTDAILGSSAKVTTVDGPAELRVPAGSQPGDTLVIPKRGVPKLGKIAMRGDHFFKVNVTIPKKISDTEKLLLEELASIRQTGKTKAGVAVAGASRANPPTDSRQKSKEEGGIGEAIKTEIGGAIKNVIDGISNFFKS